MASSKLSSLMTNAFDESKFTDLDIVLGGETFKVHKVVVCSQSSVLKAMCTGGFRESSTGVINLDGDDDMDAQKVKCLLNFLYKGKYCTFKDPPTPAPKAKPPPKANPQMNDWESFCFSRNSTHNTRIHGTLHHDPSINLSSYPYTPAARKQLRGPQSRNTRGIIRNFSSIQHSDADDTDVEFEELATVGLATNDEIKDLGAVRFATDTNGTKLTPNFHAQMYAVADKFDINDLAEHAKEMYKTSIVGCRTLSQEYLDSIVTIYTSTPESNKALRKIARNHIMVDLKRCGTPGQALMKRLREVMAEVPEFGVDAIAVVMMPDQGKAPFKRAERFSDMVLDTW